MSDYLLFYKKRLPTSGRWGPTWDIFISAYNSSDRVHVIANSVKARERYWLVLPEYRYHKHEYPTSGEVYDRTSLDETEYVSAFIGNLIPKLVGKRILIDITGFINNYVLVMLTVLKHSGIEQFDIVYGEPSRYLQSERTRFSDQAVIQVRQIPGFEGVHTTETDDDLLLLAVGYDHRLVAEVANYKEHARKVQLFGLPSLRADMYQESVLSAAQVAEAVGPEASLPQHYIFAPAHDPFVTASEVSSVVKKHLARFPKANVYLSPLSTKAQALGLGVYYHRECIGCAASIIYPYCETYMKETSEGLSQVWLYHLELDALSVPGEGNRNGIKRA